MSSKDNNLNNDDDPNVTLKVENADDIPDNNDTIPGPVVTETPVPVAPETPAPAPAESIVTDNEPEPPKIESLQEVYGNYKLNCDALETTTAKGMWFKQVEYVFVFKSVISIAAFLILSRCNAAYFINICLVDSNSTLPVFHSLFSVLEY